MIGNAVPSELAYYVAHSVKIALKDAIGYSEEKVTHTNHAKRRGLQ